MHIKAEIIGFSDCDFAGVLFFGKVFDLTHRVFEDYIKSNDFYSEYFKDKGIVYPIIHCEASYVKTLTAGDEIVVKLRSKTIRTSSFELEFEIFNKDSEIAAIVSTIHVAISKISQSKTELPIILRNLLESLKSGKTD
ncbi:MAG: acyl-CoA thioesterase [Ignavibacteriaceae bacterium]